MTRTAGLTLVIGLILSSGSRAEVVVEEYLERYFQTFPTAAIAAGRHDMDDRLENLGDAERRDWLDFNRGIAKSLRRRLADSELAIEDRLDLELLLREVERQVFSFSVLRTPERNPLFWSELLSNATVFLLVRDDQPLEHRLQAAVARADQIPRLAAQASQALGKTEEAEIAAALSALAARQIGSTATFYAEGFVLAGEGTGEALRRELARSGEAAAASLVELAGFLEDLAARASGSVRLGSLYSENFRLVTGIEEPVEAILRSAEEALIEKVQETAAFGRSVWEDLLPDTSAPQEDEQLIRELFGRVSEDRAQTKEEFVADYRDLVAESVEFVRRREIMTLPEPLTLHLGESPSFFIGQSVGGVYPAGPYAPEDSKTLLFLPTPPDGATAVQKDAFFRDFNHHFNVMITPHELIPGHYSQLKFAARHPHKVRALFGDGVYIEGWGTFAERLMLDLGWGGPLDRLAHLKKQLENIARAVVDIRVHLHGMTEDEVLIYVQGTALQDEQFAANMWRRAITSSPQLTFYFLGYSQVWGLFDDVRRARGSGFDLRWFMDGMMELGPVPVSRYRERMLGGEAVGQVH